MSKLLVAGLCWDRREYVEEIDDLRSYMETGRE